MSMSTKEAAEFYGDTAAEWLRRWDAGETVWSVEMGGLGPGYEQCIQITAAEIVRFCLANAITENRQEHAFRHMHECPTVKALGLSGAQAGAALHLAFALLDRGPAGIMVEVDAERRIQVCRVFPADAAGEPRHA